jgi:hypothetical protein
MKSLLTLVASFAVATAPGGDSRHVLRVDLETETLSAQPSTCFRMPTSDEQGMTWVLSDDGANGASLLDSGAPSFVLGDAGRVTLPQRLRGADGLFSFQDFQARIEGTSVITRQTSAELVLTPAGEGWTGTLTLSARAECRDGVCQVACEVVVPFTATPVPLHLAHAAR